VVRISIDREEPTMRHLLPALAILACGFVAGTPPAHAAVEVDPAVAAQVADGRSVRVLAYLDGTDADGEPLPALQAQALIDALLDAATARSGDSALRIERRFAQIPAFAATVDAHGLAALVESDAPLRIAADVGGRGGLALSLPLAGITATQALGLSGAGRKVAIIDSGIRRDHQSFAGRIVGEACFCGTNCCPNGQSTQFGPGAGVDDHGHGTHVAGITAGGPGVAGVPAGAAPAASVVVVKVLDQNNAFCCSSDVVAAMDWVRTNHPDAVVVNLSLGTGARFAGHCDTATAFTQSFASAVNNLRGVGTLATVSSGNNASSVDMQAPACVANAVSVGAVYKADVGPRSFGAVCTDATTAADKLTCFSNLSTTTDLLAPGAPIVAAGFTSATATAMFSGTSMAAPTVAGCVALLKEAAPSASPAAIEAALIASTTRLSRPPMVQDYPRLDCRDAAERLTGLVFRSGFEP
jgi:subtilisin family serine protease